MPIMARDSGGGREFTPCPPGLHQAVCCDVVDHHVVETQWGQKHKVSVRWQTAETMADGKPFLIQKRYTNSLHEKAVLRHDLESWRGRAFDTTELGGFDLEKLIGANCQLVVIHHKDDGGKTWANVQTITPIGRGMTKLAVRDYIRETLRKPESGADPEDNFEQPTGDDIPF